MSRLNRGGSVSLCVFLKEKSSKQGDGRHTLHFPPKLERRSRSAGVSNSTGGDWNQVRGSDWSSMGRMVQPLTPAITTRSKTSGLAF